MDSDFYEYGEMKDMRSTHILRISQNFGKGREGAMMTPTPASASSAASKCASDAPNIVNRMVAQVVPSTSFFSCTKVAMTSALSAWTTRVRWP